MTSSALKTPGESPTPVAGQTAAASTAGPESAVMGRTILQFALVAAQFAAIIYLVKLYSIESKAFVQLMMLCWCGFVAHHWLPLNTRMPFFVALSIGGIVLVMGLVNGLWLIGAGMVLIGAAHAPVAFAGRVALVVCVAAIIAVLRAKVVPASPVPAAVWPILGSMFMFRMMVYLYDMRHKAAPFTPVHSLAYFFMIPNVCFPLFPIVDYKTFCRSHYQDDAIRTYQMGVKWIFRGVLHLILYRAVYQVMQVDPANIADLGKLFQFMLATYLLYLKVSGQFHIIIGVLHLFGFNLPETHHLYLLSTSFTDFWRRINIYWKDFIMKLFFYPMYFRLKKLGHVKAMVLATLIAFGATWLLHSYQWFWLRGTFTLPVHDAVFWWVLGVLVVVNAVLEFNSTRNKSVKKKAESPFDALKRAAKAIGTFTVIVLLWSAWSSDSLTQWASVMKQGGNVTATGVVLIAGVLGAVGIGAVIMGRKAREAGQGATAGKPRPAETFAFSRSAAGVLVGCAVIFLLSKPRVQAMFGSDAQAALAAIQQPRLSATDRAKLTRGYYEDLTDTIRFNSELATLYMERPADWKRIDETEAVGEVEDVRSYELLPDKRITFLRAPLSTNRWGMRDRDYEMAKPQGVYRIAVVGASITMGWAVADGQDYPSILEELLNKDAPAERRYEVLNFAVAGYGPVSRLAVLEKKVASFKPDAVMYISTAADLTLLAEELERAVRGGRTIEYGEVTRVLTEAGCTANLPRGVFAQRIERHGPALIRWVRQRFAAHCRQNNIALYEAWLPMTHKWSEQVTKVQFEMTGQDGFTRLDVSGAYDRVADRASLEVAPWDSHPNATGHRLIAEELLRVMSGHEPFAR